MMQEIRHKLKNGETIENVCKKYQLTLKELMDLLKHYDNPIKSPRKKTSRLLYIMERDGHFFLRKSGVHYGTYHTLEDACKVKEYFLMNGWDKRNIDKACKIVGVNRCVK